MQADFDPVIRKDDPDRLNPHLYLCTAGITACSHMSRTCLGPCACQVCTLPTELQSSLTDVSTSVHCPKAGETTRDSVRPSTPLPSVLSLMSMSLHSCRAHAPALPPANPTPQCLPNPSSKGIVHNGCPICMYSVPPFLQE